MSRVKVNKTENNQKSSIQKSPRINNNSSIVKEAVKIKNSPKQ